MHSQRGITLVDKKIHKNTCKVGKAESICTYVTRQLFSYSLTAKKREGVMCRIMIKGTVQPELRGVKIGINRTAMKICVAGKCRLSCPKGHHHERSINILGGCGWVSNISQRQNIFVNFSITASVGVKKSQKFTLTRGSMQK
jgi:hypothetical protein